MSRELKPGFVPIPSNIPSTSEIETKESAPIPFTPAELEESTSSAFLFGDKHLGLWTADGTELSTIAYEEWIDITTELDETFFELRDGILGKQILTFASMADAELVHENIRREIEALLGQTAPLAKRMNLLIDRLCAVNPTMTRADIIATLHEGEILATETVDYTSKQPHRKSLLGILHDLGKRIDITLWDFENRTINDLTPVVILSDPFSKDAESLTYWSERGGESILKRSEQKTQSIIYELESLRQTMEGNGEKRNVMDALAVIEDWLESNMILYRDGKEVDFELYHLGMEEPQEVDAIFGSLDIIKHDNPEFFVQLMGINPEGGKSPYFGSFIHKALFNTQKTLDDIVTEAPNLVLKSSMKQLLRIDGTVQRWNFSETISEAALRELSRRFAEQIDAATTPQAKAQIGLMQQAMMTKPTIELAVKRQLEAMKEVNLKEIKSELLAKLDDHEHPMLAIKAISTLPLIAFRDPAIKRRIGEIFGEDFAKHPEILRRHCAGEHPEMIRLMFNQIPIFDYENGKVTNFFSIVMREAMARGNRMDRLRRLAGGGRSEKMGEFLENIFSGRIMTRTLILESLKDKKEKEFFLVQEKGRYSELSSTKRFIPYYFNAEKERQENVNHRDIPLWRALMNLSSLESWEKERQVQRKERGVMTEKDFDEERDTCVAQAALDGGRGARLLMNGFDTFLLRKKDAAKVVRVMFEHLPSLTSYEKFEFLLKHAEKFEDEDVMDFLTWFPVEEGLLREIVLAVPEKYPPVFLEYIKTLHQYGEKKYSNAVERIWIRFIDDAVESLLYKDKHDRRMDSWNEQTIINFARTPGFDEVFCKHAKRIFELYPDMPVKLYGEWGARMVKELEIMEESPEFLRRMGELCPRDGNDGVMGKWGKLLALRESVRSDERVVERKEMREMRFIASGLISGFMREFPEVKDLGYREMRGIFRERMVGFAEVERAFRVGEEKMVEIGVEERIRAQNQLEEKMNELDVKKFLEYLREHEEERGMWVLVYRKENEHEGYWKDVFRRINGYDEEVFKKQKESWDLWEKEKYDPGHLRSGWIFMRENSDGSGRLLDLFSSTDEWTDFVKMRGLKGEKIRMGRWGIEKIYDDCVMQRGTQWPGMIGRKFEAVLSR